MHVVQLLASPFVGGPERQVLGTAHALPPECRTTFISFAERGLARPFLDRARQEGFDAIELKGNFPRIGAVIRELADLLRDLDADLLCCNGYKPDLLGWRAARRANLPVVAIAHGWTGVTFKVRIYEALDARVMGWLDRVICVSEAMAEKVLRAGVPRQNVVVIRNAIDPTPYDTIDPNCRERVEAFFPNKPSLIVGAAGRLSPEKGFDVLVEAAALVCRQRDDVGFVIFGEGSMRPLLEQRIAALGLQQRVILGGFRTDLEKLLPGLDVAVLSSHTEGLPVAVLEAQAAGVPVVATAVGGTPEVIEDGITGYLTPPARPELLAEKLLLALTDPQRLHDMGRRGHQRVREEFTFTSQAARYYEVFAPLVAQGEAMSAYEIGFWVCVVLIVYPYLLYPLFLGLLAWVRPRPVRRVDLSQLAAKQSLTDAPGSSGARSLANASSSQDWSVSFILCAFNEEMRIERRILELKALLRGSGIEGEIIVVTDGSTDNTNALVRRHIGPDLQLLELPQRVGKAAALSQGVALSSHRVLVFADVRQTWADDAVLRLLENFGDPQVGAVSGDLEVTSAPGTMSGVGLYWRYEKWLRRKESLVWAQVGVTGAISACRRELFQPIPTGTLLDDVYWPLCVAMQGYRVVHDSRAIAKDRLPDKARDEFRRKVRTLAGNFQLATRLPRSLLPWRNPVWLQWLSHKLARLLVPWALAGLFVFSVLAGGWFYHLALLGQFVGYTLGVINLRTTRGGKVLSAAGSFLVLNAAAWVACWVWITGRAGQSWSQIRYDKDKPKQLDRVTAT